VIPLTKPVIDKKEIESVAKTIKSGWITQGPKVKEFEERFSKYTGAKYSAAVSSCTTALHLSLLTLGVKPGDFVITVSHSYIATANSIRHAMAEPIFVDVNSSNYNMDTESLKDLIEEECYVKNKSLYFRNYKKLIDNSPILDVINNVSGKISAIIVPHQIGIPSDIYEIKKILRGINLPIIEDAACAIGSKFNKQNNLINIGYPVGDLVCFSFHPRKLLTTGDGGMITSNNKGYIEKIKLLRNHGMNIDSFKRKNANKYFFDEHVISGFNFRMTDIQASIGVEQLKKINSVVNERKDIAIYYKKKLSAIDQVTTFEEGPNLLTNWQSFPIKIKSNHDSMDLVKYLFKEGIYSKRGVMNSHEEAPYIGQNWNLPNSEELLRHTILLPMYNGLKNKEIDYIVRKVKKFFE
tara:strand:- start:681 stop:1907 length:1227 start_codon:yes stop_codon:yes gene_type:complete